MRWQGYYHTACGASCCFSPDCACIRCSSCACSLTTLPPKRRFQCMLCEVLPPESAFDGRPEYCSRCFASPDVLHWHDVFLLVDETGEHRAVKRLHGLAEQRHFGPEDFPVAASLAPDAECGICCSEFTGSDPATCAPGCVSSHGDGVADPQMGVVDSRSFYHADCRLSWMKAQKTDAYCGSQPPLCCRVCSFEQECEAWKQDFGRGIHEINGYVDKPTPASSDDWQALLQFLMSEFQITLTLEEGTCRADLTKAYHDALKTLHRQPWLQSIVDSLDGAPDKDACFCLDSIAILLYCYIAILLYGYMAILIHYCCCCMTIYCYITILLHSYMMIFLYAYIPRLLYCLITVLLYGLFCILRYSYIAILLDYYTTIFYISKLPYISPIYIYIYAFMFALLHHHILPQLT